MKWIPILLTVVSSIFATDIPKMNLNASATLYKPSDELQMKIGVVTIGASAEEALSENSTKMRAVIANLETIGIIHDDYETNHFSIAPTYTPCPKDPPPYWQATINGYEVTNTIQIRTPKLDLAGSIIDQANQAGGNSITDIQFGLRNQRDYWAEALAAAGANAVQDAQAIATATGVRLVRVLSITLNNTQVRSPQMNLASFAKAGGSSAPPIEPGETSITASISVVYEIQ